MEILLNWGDYNLAKENGELKVICKYSFLPQIYVSMEDDEIIFSREVKIQKSDCDTVPRIRAAAEAIEMFKKFLFDMEVA